MSVLGWVIQPLAWIFAILSYQVLQNLSLSIAVLTAVLIAGSSFYKKNMEWWYSVVFFLAVFFAGFFYCAVDTPNSWAGYFQNLSLVSFWDRVWFLSLFWIC